jgi:hypothetical protein
MPFSMRVLVDRCGGIPRGAEIRPLGIRRTALDLTGKSP